MSTEIAIRKLEVTPKLWRFDLFAKNLPANFLGMAADLKFEGDLSGFVYQKAELGAGLIAKSNESQPILLVNSQWEKGVVILGLTQKSNQLMKLSDGPLVSIYFLRNSQGKLDFKGFEKQVFSVFDGKRVDLNDVQWVVNSVKKAEVIKTVVELPKKDSDIAFVESEMAYMDEGVVKDVSQSGQVALVKDNLGSFSTDYSGLWWLLLPFGGLFLIILVFLIWKTKNRLV